VRPVAVAILVLMAGCAEPPKKAEAPPPDPTLDAAYGESVAELAGLAHDAKTLIAAGKSDAAAAAITKGQPIIARVLAAPHPTLAAMEAASDLDELYGRMLLGNKNYGWARMTYQKNRSRWMHWQPQTAETERRKKQAETGIAECDRGLAEPRP
jgi:hypothetical protein